MAWGDVIKINWWIDEREREREREREMTAPTRILRYSKLRSTVQSAGLLRPGLLVRWFEVLNIAVLYLKVSGVYSLCMYLPCHSEKTNELCRRVKIVWEPLPHANDMRIMHISWTNRGVLLLTIKHKMFHRFYSNK